MLLKDKISIITGAGRGIGKATAFDFAKEGSNLVLVSRTMEELNKVKKEIESSYGVKVLNTTADISSEEDVKKMFEKTLAEFKRVDVIVNNAGIHLRKSVTDTTVKEWDKVMEINLRGTFLCCREAVKIMVKQNYGKIINVSSESGTKGSANQGAYCTSKFGQIGLTEVLADEVKDYDINVNAVLPSATNTKLLQDSYPEFDCSKFIQPEDIAKTITFVASERAKAIKGASIEVYNAQNFRPNLFNI